MTHPRSVAVLAVLVLAACADAQDQKPSPRDTVPQITKLQATGLYLTDNPLSAPAGGLSKADNAVIQRAGVVEARRGNVPDAEAVGVALTSYGGNVLMHTGLKLKRRVSSSVVEEYSGSYQTPTATRMRFGESKGNLYFTEKRGVYRLDALDGTPASAGVPKGLEGTSSLTGSSGFLPAQSSVGYRFVWGMRDGNGNLLLGAPSGRLLTSNGNTTSRDVTVTTRIPQGIVGSTHFLQIYRTEPMVYAETRGPPVVITGGVRTSGVTTLTTGSIHRFSAGQTVDVQLPSLTYPSGQKVVTAVPTDKSFSYADPGSDIAAGGGDGTASIVTYAAADPGEEMAQVAELYPTPADMSAGVISYTDVATFANGPTGYFSPSQGGIVNSKDVPPVAKDVAYYKGYAIYAVEKARQRLKMTLLAVGGSRGLNLGDGIEVIRRGEFGSWISQRYVAAGAEDPATGEFLLYTDGTPAQNIEATARSLVRVINATPSILALTYATYASSANDPPGIVMLEARELNSAPITVRAIVKSNVWAPALRAVYEASSLQRTSGVVTVDIDDNSGLSVGDVVNLQVGLPGDPNFPDGPKTISAIPVPGGSTFEYLEAGPDATEDPSLGYEFFTDVPDVQTDDDVDTNSWALSAFEEPEAVPPANYFEVGGETAVLYRVIAQADSVWFFTSEGVYRLTGDSEENFAVRPFDLTLRIIAPDSVVTLGNRVFALTDQGVAAITETGVEIVSHIPGRSSIQKVLQETQAYMEASGLMPTYRYLTHAVGYETEKEYRIWLPSTYEEGNLGVVAQAYVYNIQHGVWTRHLVPARAAVINPSEDLQYVAGDTRLSRERKARTAADYQDATGVGIPYDVAYTVLTAGNPGALKQWREVMVHLEAPAPATLGVSMATEVATTPEGGTLTTDGLTTVRTFVPVAMSYSSTLTVRMQHSTAAEKCSVLGLSVVYTNVSTAVR